MNPLAWLLGLALPACGFPAAQGLPTPLPMDTAHIVRPPTPNTALAAPDRFVPPPDIVTPSYPIPAEQLFALVQTVAGDQPRTYQAALFADRHQAHYVVRSALLNFPDLVTVQVRPEAPDGQAESGSSDLILYSRSVYGKGDLGVNRKRVVAWLAAIDQKLHPPSER